MTHTAHARERVGPVADQGGALHRLRHLAVLDQIGLAGGEDELAARDVHLSAAEVHGVETVLHRFHDVARIVLAGEHEGVGHARQRRVRVRFAAPVARRRRAHEAGVEPVLHVADEHPVLDQHVTPGRRALVVDVERAAAVDHRAVVDHRHQFGGDLLTDAARERGDALAVEVALEPVADRLVQQDARPARTEDDGHRARRRVHGRQLQRRLARRLGGEALPALRLEIEVERHAATTAEGADLTLAAILGDRRHVEPRERAHVADRPARRGGDQHDDLFARQGHDHLGHARVRRAARGVDLAHEVELARELGDDRRLGKRIEVVRAASSGHGHHPGLAGAVGDRPRLTRGLLEVLHGEIVRVRVARARARLGPHAGALAHVTRRLLDNVLLENQLFVDTVLEVDVGVVHAADEIAAEQAVHESGRDVEAVGEEALGTRPRDLFSHLEGPNPNRRRRPAPNFSNEIIVSALPSRYRA